jgi:hypothetical protein
MMFRATSAIGCRHAVRAVLGGQIHAVVTLLRSLWREYSKVAMPFENQPYPWSRDSVVENVPRRSGVYGLYSALWIYIGEADDLRERFMEHFNGESPCTRRYVPTYFVFELIDNRSARESRYRELVRQHVPSCNVEEVNRE